MLSASFLKVCFGNRLTRVQMAGARAAVLPTNCNILFQPAKTAVFFSQHHLKKDCDCFYALFAWILAEKRVHFWQKRRMPSARIELTTSSSRDVLIGTSSTRIESSVTSDALYH